MAPWGMGQRSSMEARYDLLRSLHDESIFCAGVRHVSPAWPQEPARPPQVRTGSPQWQCIRTVVTSSMSALEPYHMGTSGLCTFLSNQA